MKRLLDRINWKLVGMWVLMGVMLRIFKDQVSVSQLPTNVIFILGIGLQVVFYWIVLRKYMQHIGLWVLATIAGMLVVWLITIFLRDLDDQPFHEIKTILDAFVIPLHNAIMIFIKSAFQWAALRREVRYAYYWIIGSVIASFISEVLTILLLVPWIPNLSMRYLFYFPLGDYFVEIVFLIVTGMVIAYLLPSVEFTNKQILELETI